MDKEIVENFITDIHAVIDKYRGRVHALTAMGCLEAIKLDIMEEINDTQRDDNEDDIDTDLYGSLDFDVSSLN